MPSHVTPRATAMPEDLQKIALLLSQRHGWIPGGQQQPQGQVQNPYLLNENAPSLQNLSPTGRYNDMVLRRRALYQSLRPQGTQIVGGQEVAAPPPNQMDIDSGIGYGTNAAGQPIAVTPLGGRIVTSYRNAVAPIPAVAPTAADPLYDVEPFPGIPAVAGVPAATIRTLSSPYGKGSSIDTGTVGQGKFGIPMASGATKYVPMDIFRTPQARQLEDTEKAVKDVKGMVDDEGDFNEMLARLKKANSGK